MTSSVDSFKSIDASSAVLVGQSAASESMHAPRARFDTVCFTPREGMRAQVAEMQERIALLRDVGDDDEAAALQQKMLDEMMVEAWRDTAFNLVTTAGKTDILDKYFKGSSYTAAFFCGAISSVSYSAIAAADTMASHAGWTEAGATNAPNYTGNRPALTFGTASAGSLATSSASSFTFSQAGTIKGMFANTITTKDGTTGTLYNAVLFTGGDRVVAINDVVNVSVTYTAT